MRRTFERSTTELLARERLERRPSQVQPSRRSLDDEPEAEALNSAHGTQTMCPTDRCARRRLYALYVPPPPPSFPPTPLSPSPSPPSRPVTGTLRSPSMLERPSSAAAIEGGEARRGRPEAAEVRSADDEEGKKPGRAEPASARGRVSGLGHHRTTVLMVRDVEDRSCRTGSRRRWREGGGRTLAQRRAQDLARSVERVQEAQ